MGRYMWILRFYSLSFLFNFIGSMAFRALVNVRGSNFISLTMAFLTSHIFNSVAICAERSTLLSKRSIKVKKGYG